MIASLHVAGQHESAARPPAPTPSTAVVRALQRTAGNAAVAATLGRQPRQTVQRCPGVHCTCGHDDDELTLALAAAARSRGTLERQVLQRRVICPEGVDPEEGTGCYEVSDDDAAPTPDGAMTPSSGTSYDPDEGGVSEALPDGGFTPVPGAESYDPDAGGASRNQPPTQEPWGYDDLPPYQPGVAPFDEPTLEPVTEEEFQRREEERRREEMLSCEHLHGEPREICELRQGEGGPIWHEPGENATPRVPPRIPPRVVAPVVE